VQDVFLSNKAGLSVGLFGKWGQGKSSIVKLLSEGLKGTAKVIVFNAWKASGDSIRRQLLLNILHEIAPKKAVELKRFVGLEIVESLLLTEKETQKKKSIARLKTAFDPILWLMLFWPLAAMVALFLAGLLLVMCSLFNVYGRGEVFLKLALALFFPAAISLSVYVARTVKQRYYGRLSNTPNNFKRFWRNTSAFIAKSTAV
jgi:energy-coupling factor transporter ATP-binding protein EcfA2